MDRSENIRLFFLFITVFIFFVELQATHDWNSGRSRYYGRENNYGESDPKYYYDTESDHQSKSEEQICQRIRPHIVIIQADDLGWNDVSWNNEEFRKVTPNLGKLAEEGVILDSYYSPPVCTPSRAGLLLGLYPFKTGFQNQVLIESRVGGIDPSLSTLPERLRNLGYSTNIVGKWHLGFCKNSFTPTKVGYNSFYGQFSGKYDDYFTKLKFRIVPSVRDDPFETNNLADQEPQIVLRLLPKLAEYEKDLVPSFNENPPKFIEADPKNFGGVWSPGWC